MDMGLTEWVLMKIQSFQFSSFAKTKIKSQSCQLNYESRKYILKACNIFFCNIVWIWSSDIKFESKVKKNILNSYSIHKYLTVWEQLHMSVTDTFIIFIRKHSMWHGCSLVHTKMILCCCFFNLWLGASQSWLKDGQIYKNFKLNKNLL